MSDEFTAEELRRGVEALALIHDCGSGSGDELAYRVAEARRAVPNADPWCGVPWGTQAAARLAADQLANLIGASREECHQAAAAACGGGIARAVYAAIMEYEAELKGSQSTPQPTHRTAPQQTKPPAPQPSVRIVRDKDVA
jgi:hypothetical protein